jgi:hypothetical protein
MNRYATRVNPNRHELLSLVKIEDCVAGSITACHTNIKLHESMMPYCCIIWNGKYYMFTKVPFGIQCAPACCQTLTRGFVYLDDQTSSGYIWSSSKSEEASIGYEHNIIVALGRYKNCLFHDLDKFCLNTFRGNEYSCHAFSCLASLSRSTGLITGCDK